MVITIRNIDKRQWEKLKLIAVKSRLTLGATLHKAIDKLAEEYSDKVNEEYMVDIKPLRTKGKIPSDVSNNVDKYLYGE